MSTFLSLFTGADGAGEGARQAGYDIVGGVEFRADLAAIAKANHLGARIVVADVRAADYTPWRGVAHVHASPSCKKASIANAERGETLEDIEAAQAVCRAIREVRPRSVTIENVRGYGGFEAYARIIATLRAEGYGLAAGILNAADYGVPQTRERLIVVAVRGLPDWAVTLPPATHAPRRDQGDQMSLFDAPSLPPWAGWYGALDSAGLLGTLPPSAFAPWQLARLPAEARGSVLIRGDNSQQEITPDRQYRRVAEPAPTVRTSAPPRALIVDDRASNANGDGPRDPVIVAIGDPVPTVPSGSGSRRVMRAWLVGGSNTSEVKAAPGVGVSRDDEPSRAIAADAGPTRYRAWLSTGRVVQMTPRALSVFQSFPLAYTWPRRTRPPRLTPEVTAWLERTPFSEAERAHVDDWLGTDAALTCEAVGNAVPVALMRSIMEHVRRLATLHVQEAA